MASVQVVRFSSLFGLNLVVSLSLLSRGIISVIISVIIRVMLRGSASDELEVQSLAGSLASNQTWSVLVGHTIVGAERPDRSLQVPSRRSPTTFAGQMSESSVRELRFSAVKWRPTAPHVSAA